MLKALFHSDRIIRTDFVAPQIAHLLGAGDQHMLAMYANDGDENCQQWRHYQSTILERIPHRKESRSNVALEQMHNGLQVAAFWLNHHITS